MIDVKQVFKACQYDSTSTTLIVWVLNQVCAANIRQKEIQQRQKKSVKGRRMQVLQNTTMKFLQAQISLISNKFLPFCRPWGGTPGVGGIPIGGGGTPMGWKPKGG